MSEPMMIRELADAPKPFAWGRHPWDIVGGWCWQLRAHWPGDRECTLDAHVFASHHMLASVDGRRGAADQIRQAKRELRDTLIQWKATGDAPLPSFEYEVNPSASK